MRRALDVRLITEGLVTSGVGTDDGTPWAGVDVHDELGSTNAECARLAQPWRVVAADAQTRGRGRLGRVWEIVPRSSVAVSVLVPAPDAALSWVPLGAGLAVHRAVGAVTGVETVLKWPNDVLAPADGDRKLSGILCERVGAGVVVGAGINVDQTREELPVDTATSLRLAGSGEVSREALIAAYLRHLAAVLRSLAAGGADRAAVREDYRAVCRTVGSVVDLHLVRDGQPVVERVLAAGVDDDGRLSVRGPEGSYTVAAGDVVHVRPGSRGPVG